MNGPWKCYRAWLRLKARRARGLAIKHERETNWERVKVWNNDLHWTRDGVFNGTTHKEKDYAGFVLIYGEENGFGSRRIKVIQNDYHPTDTKDAAVRLHESKLWREVVMWRERVAEEQQP